MSQTLTFSVSSQSESPARTKINTRGFQLVVDEPQELGGTNQAPNPVEYILAGYAGCINVVAHIVAKELQIKLKDLQINIEGDLNPDRLFGTNFKDRAGYKHLHVRLSTSTKLDKALETKWLKEIELRCPVNDNLSNKTPIKLSLN
ncbi:OsmC family protein [Fulvivirga aurantia]|uniref:OsmC family protein n=1 Tax=Fulvivirga aurantia TaxID=2529383 RepID=UPI001CA3D916|nr:OsmC family protein [Fulvivirga aurantia]